MLISEYYNNIDLKTLINLIYGGSIIYMCIIGLIIKILINLK